MLDAFKDLGFRYATQAGITISKNDVVVPPNKAGDPRPVRGRGQRVEESYDTGLITQEERHQAVTDKWQEATDEVGRAMEANLDRLNPIYMMANSGARGSFKQIRQLAGMRGVMANPKGEYIERPIKSNFIEGLSVLEYFISTHGARKGLADTALRTADSGYLTRRLVDVAQDVIIRQDDCKTKEHIRMPVLGPDGEVNPNLVGRVAAVDIKTKRGRVLVDKGAEIDRHHLEELREADLKAEHGDEGPARPGALGAQVRGSDRRVPGLLRPRDGHGQPRRRSATRWASSPRSRSASRARS